MITIIHNLYKLNPHVNETLRLNLMALDQSGMEYQYLCFNDHGDEKIYDDIKEFENKIEYVYSDINYGMKMCTGGWIGAIPYIKGDIVHNVGQDDVMTPMFYSEIKSVLENNSELDFYTSNGFRVDDNLKMVEFMSDPRYKIDYNQPIEIFKQWFGVKGKEVTRANNFMLASGTVYRTKLHEEIGIPDIKSFVGAADFEYWARILFYGKKGFHNPLPNWYYRMSKFSAAFEVIEGKSNGGYWLQKAVNDIFLKYKKLWEER